MPIGPYRNFNACVKDQLKKGKKEDSAKKVCGFLQKKAEGESQKNWRLIEYYAPIESYVVEKRDANFDEFIITGIAINETITRNNVKYTAEELEPAAKSLVGKPILKDHENRIDAIVGKVKNAHFDAGAKAIKFTGKITDENIKGMISEGIIEHVSIGAMVKDLAREEGEGKEYVIAKGIEFVELSLVPIPGDANATFNQAVGEAWELREKEDLTCPECGEEFENKKEMEKHMKSEHEEMEEKKHETVIKEPAGKDPTPGFDMSRCMSKVGKFADDPAAFCRWAYDQGLNALGENAELNNKFIEEKLKEFKEVKNKMEEIKTNEIKPNFDAAEFKSLKEKYETLLKEIEDLKKTKVEDNIRTRGEVAREEKMQEDWANYVLEDIGNRKFAIWKMPDKRGKF